MSTIRLLTDGGIPFDAIHKYGLMCKRLTFDIFNHGPFTATTVKLNQYFKTDNFHISSNKQHVQNNKSKI